MNPNLVVTGAGAKSARRRDLIIASRPHHFPCCSPLGICYSLHCPKRKSKEDCGAKRPGLVEHHLAKVNVDGQNSFARPTFSAE